MENRQSLAQIEARETQVQLSNRFWRLSPTGAFEGLFRSRAETS